MRGASEIVGMSGEEQAGVFADGAARLVAGRYEAAIALASLARSQRHRDLGFGSVELAAARSRLEPWEVTQLLWVGRALLDRPELDAAFRTGVLSWSKVKALVAHVTPENVERWIKKAHGMSSNALEHELAKQREPVIGERMVPMYVPEHALAWFRELLRRKQAEPRGPRERNLNDGEFFYRMLDLMQASMDDPATVPAPMGPVLPVPHSPDRSRHIPVPVQEAVLKRARYRCERCGNRLAIVFHHAVIPFAEGGPHTVANIEAWCGRCHDAAHHEEQRRTQARKGLPPAAARDGGGPIRDRPGPAPAEPRSASAGEPVLTRSPPVPCGEAATAEQAVDAAVTDESDGQSRRPARSAPAHGSEILMACSRGKDPYPWGIRGSARSRREARKWVREVTHGHREEVTEAERRTAGARTRSSTSSRSSAGWSSASGT